MDFDAQAYLDGKICIDELFITNNLLEKDQKPEDLWYKEKSDE